MMMRAVDGTVLIGEHSFGSSGNPRTYELGNGVSVTLPSWKAMTLDGKPFEGIGIAPDIEIIAKPADLEWEDTLLMKAIEVIESKSMEPVTVADVERLVGISGRTLRHAFEVEFGVSPKQYVMAFRLNKVRSRLLNRDHLGEPITDIANEWGFWHMGQFARDYRRMFGELPSQTIAG